MQMWYNSLRFINMGIGPFAGDTSFFPLAERTLARALGAGGGRDRLGERRPRPRRFSDSLSLLLSSSSMSSSASSSSLESSSSSWYRRICWSFCRAAATAAARVLFVPDEVEATPLVEVLGSGSIDCLDFPELPEVVATSDSQNIKLKNGKANKVYKKKNLIYLLWNPTRFPTMTRQFSHLDVYVLAEIHREIEKHQGHQDVPPSIQVCQLLLFQLR